MINGIGSTGPSGLGATTVQRNAQPARVENVQGEPGAEQATLNPAAELAAAGPPVDAEKVAAIRAAIAEGRYPIDPQAIAAKMIELDLPPRP
jgi:negative regulator of flagellin synthesis FlgM